MDFDYLGSQPIDSSAGAFLRRDTCREYYNSQFPYPRSYVPDPMVLYAMTRECGSGKSLKQLYLEKEREDER